MTALELKRKVQELGFEEENTMLEMQNTFFSSVNHALDILSTEIPCIERKTITLDTPSEVDLEEVTEGIIGTVTEILKNGQRQVIDIIGDRYLKLDIGTYNIYYTVNPKPVFNDNDKLLVNRKAEHLLALLTAHYMWLDDDIEKAIIYWNEYDSLKQILLVKEQKEGIDKKSAEIIGGIGWLN